MFSRLPSNASAGCAATTAQSELHRVIELRVPVLRFVHRLDRIGNVERHSETELETDIIRREQFLPRDREDALAQVERAHSETEAPHDVTAWAELAHKLTMLVEQACFVVANHD